MNITPLSGHDRDRLVYSGQMRNDTSEGFVRHGQGQQVWPDGSRYEGDWQDGQANGYGTLHYNNGDIFVGNFKDDKLNGYGELKYANGDLYKGYW